MLRQRVGQQTILIVEHKISHVKDFVQRLTVMHEGRVIADGGCEEMPAASGGAQKLLADRDAGRGERSRRRHDANGDILDGRAG